MSRTPDQVSTDIRARLRVTDPSLDAGIGTPERKIIDAVAEVISSAYIDSQIISTSWDIDVKVGVELDQLVGLFGFGRLEGRRATGRVKFSLNSPATQVIGLPSGTQVFSPATDVFPEIPFTTLTPGQIGIGMMEVEVNAECSIAGSLGNVSSNSITGAQTVLGVGEITNPEAFTGGVDPETDEELRQRFKDTFMRNLAGVEDFYEALCLQYDYVSKVRALGPVNRYREQLEIQTVSGNKRVTSLIPSSKYTWPYGDFVVSDPGTVGEKYYIRGLDYTCNYASPPRFDFSSGSTLQAGDVVEIEHEYTSSASRNDPDNGITNKVDIFINGNEALEVNYLAPPILETFVSSGDPKTTPMHRDNFVRDDGTKPTSGRKFLRLGSTPVLSPPESMFNGTKVLGTDYFLVRSTTNEAGSVRAVEGLEFISDPGVDPNTPVPFTYSYNRSPELMQAMVEMNRQITTDVLVRAARYRRGKVHVYVILDTGISLSSVTDSIKQEVSRWAATVNYGEWVQLSDIEALIHGISGVDAVRIVRSEDSASNYGVSFHHRNGAKYTATEADFRLDDDELLLVNDVSVVRKSENTFGRQ